MIRDAYGSLAIMSELENKTSNKVFTSVYENLKKRHQANVVDLLEKAL